jgi:hypothetical protein
MSCDGNDYHLTGERLFQRTIDLVTEQSVRNPYFRRVVDASRELVYERQDPQTPV